MFYNVFNERKTRTNANLDGLELRRCEDIKGIVAPEIGPKSFGTFEKRAAGLQVISCMSTLISVTKCPRALWLNLSIACDEGNRRTLKGEETKKMKENSLYLNCNELVTESHNL